MLNILPIPANDIITYMNLAFIGIILIGALVGFCRGTMKSTFFAIMSILVFVGGWLLMGPISNKLMTMDYSKFNIQYEGIVMHKPLEFAKEIMELKNPELAYLFTEGSYSLELIKGLIDIVFKIVYVVLLIVLSFTLFWIISGIIWIFVRIPFRKIFCHPTESKGGKKKYKVSIFSRLGGLGIGAVKGLMYTLLIGFIFAGLASVSDSLKEIAQTETPEAVVVCNDNSFTVVELNAEGEEVNPEGSTGEQPSLNDMLNEYGDVLDVISGYRKTISGKVFGSIKYGKNKVAFDEYVFDTIFSVKVGDTKVKLRNELRTIAKAFSCEAVQQVMTNGFEISKLKDLAKEDLDELITILSELNTVKVVVPVGIEFVAYSNILEDALGSEYDSIKELLNANLEDLLKLDVCKDVKSLGYVFVDVLDLIGDDLDDLSKVDYLNFDQATLNDIFANLKEIDILEVVALIAVNYLINVDAVQNAINDAGFNIEDLGLSDLTGEDYVNELMNLPKIYEKVVDLGLKMVDGKIDLTGMDPEKVAGFTESIFNSIIISNAIPVVATTLTKYLPEEYKGLFTEEELKNTNWKNEFTPLLTAVASLMKTGIIDSKDPIQNLTNMSDQEFSDLGKYLSQSTLITSHLNEILDILMTQVDLGEIKFVGLDETKGEKWDETEIVSLFKAVKIILNTELITSNNPTQAFKDLTNEEIDSLSIDLGNSKFFTKNLNGIITYAITQLDGTLKLEALDATQGENWNQMEIAAVLTSVKTIVDTGLIDAANPLDVVKTLSNSTVENLSINISTSTFMTKNIDNLLGMFTGTLEFELAHLEKDEWTTNEIYSVLKSICIVAGSTTGTNIDVESILNLGEEQLGVLLESKLLTQTLKNVIVEKSQPGQELDILKGVYADGKDEHGNQVYIWNDGRHFANCNVTADGKLTISPVTNALKYVIYKNGCYFTTTEASLVIDLNKVNEYKYDTKDKFTVSAIVENGELRKAFNAISALEITNLSTGVEIDLRNVVNKKDVLLDSYILTETLINQIRLQDNDNPSGILEISTEFKEGGSGEWHGTDGELVHIINALDLALGISTSKVPVLIDSINMDSVSLKRIVDGKDTLLQSNILTDTIIVQLQSLDGTVFNLPIEYKTEDLTVWKDSSTGEEGELTILFNVISNLVPLPETGFNIDVNKLEVNNILVYENDILKSAVLTSTVVNQIAGITTGIIIPNEYKIKDNASWENDYDLWKNTYVNGLVETKGELFYILGAIDGILNISSSTTPIYINDLANKLTDIYVEDVINKQDVILHSNIINYHIVDKIKTLKANGISIPNEYMSNYDLWKNTYDSNDKVITRGETSRLLNAVDVTLGLNSTTHTLVDGLQLSNFELGNITKKENRDKVLYSNILSETLKDQVIKFADSKTISLPLNYNDVTSPNYFVWNNTYNEKGEVLTRGELNYALGAIDLVAGKASITDFSKLDFVSIFEVTPNADGLIPQDEILKSKIISETIINKVLSSTGTDIVVPNAFGLQDEADRTAWFNSYDGEMLLEQHELANLINALNKLLNDSQKHDLGSINLYEVLDTIVSKFADSAYKDVVLRSLVLSETLRVNISKVEAIKDPHGSKDFIQQAFDINYGAGADVNDISKWYGLDSYGNPEHKELWHLLTGVSLILGSTSFKDLTNFSLSNIVDNPNMIPEYDSNYVVINSNIETMLQSIIIETIFVEITKPIYNQLKATVLNEPEGGFIWYKKDLNGTYTEHDLRTFLESYYIMQKHINYNDITATIDTLIHLGDGTHDEELNHLAAGMVISRSFRGSIALMFNKIFKSHYVGLYASHSTIMKPWDEVAFNQTKYDNATNNKEAHDLFVADYKNICNEINKAN